MPAIIKPESSSHWYTRDGLPCYEVPCKSKPGEMRATSLADARKLDLLPSVTSILSIKAKPGLEAWKTEQVLLASQTLTRLPDETDATWIKRVIDDAYEYSRQARSLGSALHSAVDLWVTSKGQTKCDTLDGFDVAAMLNAYIIWHKSNVGRVVASERAFAGTYYGGRVDLEYRPISNPQSYVVTDFKTKATKPKQKLTPYSEWGMQLAAYAYGLQEFSSNPIPIGCLQLQNIVLSTTEPGRIEVIDWTDERAELYQDFQACKRLWCREKKYWPAKRKEISHDSGSEKTKRQAAQKPVAEVA